MSTVCATLFLTLAAIAPPVLAQSSDGAAPSAQAAIAGAALAAAPLDLPAKLNGDVIASRGRWSSDHRRIVTDVTLRTDDGTLVTLVQDGGSVDGLRQVSFPGDLPLEPGERVTTLVHRGDSVAAGVVVGIDEVVARRQALGGRLPFVRTGPSKGNHFLKWKSGCAFLSYAKEGTTDVEGENEFAVMDAVLQRWMDDAGAGSYLQLVSAGTTESEVGKDAVNLIKFREQTWCRPKAGDLPAKCHNAAAAGITTVIFVDDASSARDGEILDADVELNAVNFAVSVDGVTLGPQMQCKSDLANTLTHEIGHLMGLDHTCADDNTPAGKTDYLGNPVPSCFGPLPPEITEATMYNFQDCGETKKASPEADDLLAIRTVYAAADDPNTCDPAVLSAGCCNVGDRGGVPASSIILVMVTAVGLRRRRRQG